MWWSPFLVWLSVQGAEQAPRVFIECEDRTLVGFLATAWLDDGWAVVPTRDGATHALSVEREPGGGFRARVDGSSRESRIDAGADALMHLELLRRASALIELEPGRAAAAAPLVSVRTTFRGAREPALRDQLHAALLARGVALGPPARDRDQLCVDVGRDLIVLSWGRACDGRPVAVSRAGLAPSLLAQEAVGLRGAAPLVATRSGGGDAPAAAPASSASVPVAPGPPAASAAAAPSAPSSAPSNAAAGGPVSVAPSAAAPDSAHAAAAAVSPATPTTPASASTEAALPNERAHDAPVSATPEASSHEGTRLIVAIAGGALGRTLAFDPFGSLSLAWEVPLPWGASDARVVVGPSVRVLATGARPHELLTLVEAAPLIGGRVAWPLGPVFVVGALEVGSWLHTYIVTDEQITLRPAFAAAAHAGVSWAVLSWLALDAQAAVGGIPVARIHVVAGEAVWRREAMFLAFSVGVAARIPFVPSPL